ncbi:hypothetical protein L596_030112 [Steinernema carpocapsae]|uniref:Uncharacterized protein n=1 Tax=Steinernema carpocapsae TaxID=34508 RepID=A0A4U5LRS9_STECR|nr:hypothetical protein L596_030112 [Steinernema carpocapsae]
MPDKPRLGPEPGLFGLVSRARARTQVRAWWAWQARAHYVVRSITLSSVERKRALFTGDHWPNKAESIQAHSSQTTGRFRKEIT